MTAPDSMRRGTGGNRFIDGEASKYDLLSAVMDGLADLERWFDGTSKPRAEATS